MMKIIYIYTALTSIGGVDRVLSTKANYLAEKLGYEVYIITDSQAGKPLAFPLSSKVIHIDLHTDFDEQYHYGIIKRTICYFRLMKIYKKKLEKTIHEIRPDIVISICGRELDFLNKIKDGSIKIGESHIAKKYCRNFHLLEQKGFIYWLVAKYWRHKQENAIKKLDAFVVLTEKDAKSWAKIKKAKVIPNPFSFTPIHKSDCLSNKIISVGRLNEQKGYDMLIKAWSYIHNDHPNWSIFLYGNGEKEKEYKDLINKLNIEDTFHILPPTNKIIDKYCESSFYVMSSRFEGLPMVLLEAMSCGIPCISFDCPHGPSELITNEVNGYLVKTGNIKDLSMAIKSMIINEDKRIAMGKNAYLYVQKYSPESIMQIWDKLFKDLKYSNTIDKKY